MNRIITFLLLMAFSVTAHGQLSLETLRSNAETNLLNEGYSVSYESTSPLNTEKLRSKTEENVSLLGLKFGVNLSRVESDSIIQGTSYKSGFHGGMQFGIYYSQFFTLETGLLYDGKGYAKTNTEETVVDVDTASAKLMKADKYDISARFNYLQIPLYGRFTFGDHVQFYTNFGFYMGIPLGTSQEGTIRHKRTIQYDNGMTESLPTMIDTLSGNAEAYSGFELGGSVGIGFLWPLEPKGFTGPPTHLLVDIKYQGSLASIGKGTEEEVEIGGETKTVKYPAPEVFNRGLSVTAGIVFPLSVQ